MSRQIIVPAQIRAARALLEWSQEDLARAANVGVTTIRDLESGRRPTEASSTRDVQRALDNEDVVFLAGDSSGGPGVRFASGRPHVIRPPVMTIYDGLFFGVEWEGKDITVSVSYEVIQDLGEFAGQQNEAAYQKLFVAHRGKILGAAARALAAGRIDRHSRVRLTAEDFPSLVPLLDMST
jgi:transcriptional regulator with XRE-family HTH domain